MRYLGGKHRIAKELGAYLRTRQEGRYFVEPFCGALNITCQMSGPRLACDASPYLFSLYRGLREGWEPPDVVTEELYRHLKTTKDPADPLTAFVGYGCCFGGGFFTGYARSSGARNYAGDAKRSLARKMALCTEVTFACCDYARLTPGPGCLVYCDPPYAGTTGYGAVGKFDSPDFWRRTQEWAHAGALVLVSEYVAPIGRCVWEKAVKTDMHGVGRDGRVEKLFEVAP